MSSSPIESFETAAERRGASVLLETLSSVGCEYVFGNPGTTELPLMDALLDAPQLKYVWALQEASDVAMADGYAQAAGKPGFINSSSAQQYSFLRGGGLGWGMPAAVGCSLGLGREPVVCLVGDGAALYSPQALWTAAYEKLPVTFIVMNNREYNVLKNFMRSQEHYTAAKTNRFVAMEIDSPPIDYLALAVSMGVPARRVDRAGDIAQAIEAGIASGATSPIEVVISSA
jgi:benzoylformate decarboxylase